jgi:uncharacterized protein with GYD domain
MSYRSAFQSCPEKEMSMATFISTLQFTPQGIARIRDTCQRAAGFKAAAKKAGVKVTEVYWTLGPSDGLIILEAPDEETATACMLQLVSLGNVQTQTARAFKVAEMEKTLAKLPAPSGTATPE